MSSRALSRPLLESEARERASELAALPNLQLQEILDQHDVKWKRGDTKKELVARILFQVHGLSPVVIKAALARMKFGKGRSAASDDASGGGDPRSEESREGVDGEGEGDGDEARGGGDGEEEDGGGEEGDGHDDVGQEDDSGRGHGQDVPNGEEEDEEDRGGEDAGTGRDRPQRKKTPNRRYAQALDGQIAVDVQLDEAARKRGETIEDVLQFADPPRGGARRPVSPSVERGRARTRPRVERGAARPTLRRRPAPTPRPRAPVRDQDLDDDAYQAPAPAPYAPAAAFNPAAGFVPAAAGFVPAAAGGVPAAQPFGATLGLGRETVVVSRDDLERLFAQRVSVGPAVNRFPPLDTRSNPFLAERVRDQPMISLAAAAFNSFGTIGEHLQKIQGLLGSGAVDDAIKQGILDVIKIIDEQRGVLHYACVANPRTAALISTANSDWMRDHAADIKRAERLANAVDAANAGGNAPPRWPGGGGHGDVGGGGNGGGRRETRTCYYCKKEGHVEANCRAKARNNISGGSGAGGGGGNGGVGGARGGGRSAAGGAGGI